MPRPIEMRHRNTLLYVLTQVIGISVLLACLAYGVQNSGLDMTLPAIFNATGLDAVSHRSWLEAAAHALNGLVLPCLILVNGALALRSRGPQAAKPARMVFFALFALFVLGSIALWLFRHDTGLVRPALPGRIGIVEHSSFGLYFLLFELYFAGWALGHKRLRWLGLGLAVAAGLIVSLLLTLQGIHYLSETIWAAAVAWLLCSVLFFRLIMNRHDAPGMGERPSSLEEIWEHLSTVQLRRRRTLTLYGAVLACLMPFMSSLAPAGAVPHEAVEWTGLGLIIVAMLGRCWCMLYLGGRKGTKLMDQGPYSISRNPLYWFSIIAVVGMGAQSGSLLLGPVLALYVYAIFRNVIDEEERLLRKTFGSRFEAYCARVPRFGPRLSGWRSADHLTVSVSGLWNTLRDALPYFLAIPVFELIEWAQASGWVPVLIRLP